MPESDIKRVNFFDGQFLKQGEFLDLDFYHRHMRRRMIHTLFDQSGVVQLDPVDLTVEVENASAKLIRVRAGTALGMRDDLVEAREIVLREDEVIDLTVQNPPIQPGDSALVTIHYDEQTTDPSSEGGVTGDTRVDEQAVLSVHRNALPAPTAANDEPYVILGEVDFDTMALDDSQRQQALIRAGLLGTPPSTSPTIGGISPASAEPGATVTVQITGTNLGGASAIAFSGTGIAATIQPGGTDTSFDVELVVDSTAAVGPRTFTVTTPAGTANSGSVVFEITALTVNVTSISSTLVNIQSSGDPGQLTVRGNNIRDAALAPGDPATGTVVRFVEPGNPTNVLATASNPVVLSNAGATQQVEIDLPLQGDFTVQMSPLAVQVEFGGGSGIAPQELTAFF